MSLDYETEIPPVMQYIKVTPIYKSILTKLSTLEQVFEKGPACDSYDCSTPKGGAKDCKWGWECQEWVTSRTKPKECEMDRWIVAKETVVDYPDWEKSQLGYTVVHSWPTFDTKAEAHEFVYNKNLPLGWVVMQQSQLHFQ